ncbi:NACHT domain-containing protein [Streptomyces sp. NPDC096205]|uniref:NACHT domain-containing protein n=1 Tax=Streptomyces sp. NPDC096205 TaxID=3366081 RepID=UPI0038191234
MLGDPGAGKSMLARYVALALAGATDMDADLAPLSGSLPLLVELRAYAETQWRSGTLLDLVDHLHGKNRRGLPKDLLEGYLRSGGRAVVIFDGLDELFDPRLRDEVTDEIAGFAARYPSARVVVTSRVIGYQRAVLERAGFRAYMLQNFDRAQIDAFVTSWYRSAFPADPIGATGLRDYSHDERLAEDARRQVPCTSWRRAGAPTRRPGTCSGASSPAEPIRSAETRRSAHSPVAGATTPAPRRSSARFPPTTPMGACSRSPWRHLWNGALRPRAASTCRPLLPRLVADGLWRQCKCRSQNRCSRSCAGQALACGPLRDGRLRVTHGRASTAALPRERLCRGSCVYGGGERRCSESSGRAVIAWARACVPSGWRICADCAWRCEASTGSSHGWPPITTD